MTPDNALVQQKSQIDQERMSNVFKMQQSHDNNVSTKIDHLQSE